MASKRHSLGLKTVSLRGRGRGRGRGCRGRCGGSKFGDFMKKFGSTMGQVGLTALKTAPGWLPLVLGVGKKSRRRRRRIVNCQYV